MKVYKIVFEVDDFRSLLAKDDSVAKSRLLAFDGSSRVARWLGPLEAVIDNAELPVPDIYDCGVGNMLLSGRSLTILQPAIASVAELLPVVWEGGNGLLVNIVGFSDCLDLEQTEWCRDQESGKRLFIERHAFIPDLVPHLFPFKIKEQRFALFCADHEDGSDNLRSLIKDDDLTGISFETVWMS